MFATRSQYRALLFFGVMMSLLAASEIYQRSAIQLDGTVISSETSCVQPENNRCDTVYIVERSDHSRVEYIAGPVDHSLRRRLPVGTNIVKNKWALDYTINGVINRDFPTKVYFVSLGIGLCCAIGLFALKSGT